MTSTFTVHAAKTNLSKLIERAENGEEIVIARGKKPVARLVPMSAPSHIRRRRAFGALKRQLKLPDAFFFDPLPDEELDLWDEGGGARPKASVSEHRTSSGSGRRRKPRS